MNSQSYKKTAIKYKYTTNILLFVHLHYGRI